MLGVCLHFLYVYSYRPIMRAIILIIMNYYRCDQDSIQGSVGVHLVLLQLWFNVKAFKPDSKNK